MGVWWRPAVRVLVLSAAWALGGGQVRYSVPEEAKGGTVVGRLAQDLGLEAGEAEARRLRLVAQGRRASVEVSGASGALVVSSRLDREELCGKSAPCALRLEVLVERPLRVFHVELEVTDINDNAPLFPAAQKNLSIAESSLVQSRFPLEGASDADVGANAQLSYTLSPSEHFSLDLKKSTERNIIPDLVLTKPLDRETLPMHRLVVTASDGGRPSLTGTMELLISVLDANDNAPQFNQSVYKVQLPESAAEGTLVTRLNATDPDGGLNKEFSYSIVSSLPAGSRDLFIIDPKTGEIRLTGALDFEHVRLHEIKVEARDQGTPPLSGHCSVELEVLDVNDNVPEVRVTSLSVPVPEDAAVGTVVALLSVSDRDSGANGRVRCAVWPAAPFGLAATFAGSYSLVLREALDRERVSEYEVEVRAEDGGAPPLRASRGLRVPVSDVNDNAPAFAQAVYTVLARENNAAGAELARLWARDPDEAGNGRVSYSVAEGAGGAAWAGGGWRPASSYVSVDAESGRLWALQPLDYEELQVLQFEVRAVDAGEPPLCGNATVQLFVVDENDNAPALLPAGGGGPGPGVAGEAASGPSGALWAWAAWGAPAGQVVAKIRAVDADSGYNAWLRYELWEPRGKSPFRVGLYSGEVSTARALEEADGPRQRLVIVVRDHGEPARSATATLSVSLVEGGEAALAGAGAGSSSSSGAGTGLRAAEGGGAVALSANVWLVVAICAVSSLFVLAVVLYGAWRWAPRAGALSGPGPATLVCASEVGSWSYSQRQSRSLCVAEGAGKSDLMVFSPNFPLPPPPGATVKEAQPEPPALLDTVREAVLAGGGGGRAGPGRVAAAMGVWWGPAVRVLVLSAAWALGGGQVRYSVPEEAKGGTVVGRLAQDLGLEAGEAEARRLRLVAQGRRASVEVSGASGALVVSSRLDREELCGKSAPCALRLEVLVERPLRVFHVELEVTDINDNAPLFPAAQKNLSIAESSLVQSRFPLEGASDADIGSNAQLTYTLSPSEHFRIEEENSNSRSKSLFLVLVKPLDRETLPVHRLVVTASDGGRPSLTGTMELLISVLDVNDNAPQFNQSVLNVALPEDSSDGTPVVRVRATDPDLGIYGQVLYAIDTVVPLSSLDVFSIDATSGEIRLTGRLDFETVSFYDLLVKATDKGTPPLSGHVKVVVEVLDVNDNAPEVRVTSLSVPVPEDAAVGTVVALLSVSDRDSGANGRVRCAVWPAAPFGLVATFAGSYSLVLREALDRERVSEYEVEVRAEDGGAPPLRASRGLRVPVSDVNDNAPAFAQAVYTVLARENNAAGAELARLWARDPDEAGNGRVSYSVAEGTGGAAWAGGGWRPASSYVAVDAESGRLWALQPLDYEELQVLQFEVRAVDAGEPPLCGNATVQLFVVDENDNAPALLPAGGGGPGPGAAGEAASGPSGALWAWAAWGAPAGQVVAKIRAVDADSGYNAWLRYELWEPRGKSPFRVGLYSGEVSTARALEEADGPRQRLVIVVRDHGEPARSATATLSVSLVEGGEAALAGAGAGMSSSSGAGTGLRAAEGGGASALSSAALSANVWLVVAICAVSSLFVLAVVLYGAWRWAPRAGALSGPGPATLVCASEVGSWSYSQRQSRSLCVAEGAGKSDLMVFSPNFPLPPPPGAAAKETQPEQPALLDTVSGPPLLASLPSLPSSLLPSDGPSPPRPSRPAPGRRWWEPG
ncbi:uncharacterized protein FYW35_006736 [Pterocles gutturalis]